MGVGGRYGKSADGIGSDGSGGGVEEIFALGAAAADAGTAGAEGAGEVEAEAVSACRGDAVWFCQFGNRMS